MRKGWHIVELVWMSKTLFSLSNLNQNSESASDDTHLVDAAKPKDGVMLMVMGEEEVEGEKEDEGEKGG